jgi:origin recognition complex subunit 1
VFNYQSYSSLSLRDEFYCRQRYDPVRQKFHPSRASAQSREEKSDSSAEEEEDDDDDNEDDDDDEQKGSSSKSPRKKGPAKRCADTQAAVKSKRPKPTTEGRRVGRPRKLSMSLQIPTTPDKRQRPEAGMGLARTQLHVATVPDSLPCREV